VARRELTLLDVLLRRPEPRLGLAVGLVVAIALHVLIVPGTSLLPGRAHAVKPTTPGSWSGRALTQQQRVEVELRRAEPPPKPIPAPQPEEDPAGQVVSLPARVEERPDAADFVAEQDQKTARETRARVTGMTKVATRAPSLATPQPAAPTPSMDGAVAPTAPTKPAPGGLVGAGDGRSGDALIPDSRDGGGEQSLAMLTPRREARQGLDDTGRGELRVQRRQEGLDGNSNALRIAMSRIAPLQAPLGGGGFGAGFSRIGGSGEGDQYGAASTAGAPADAPKLSGLPRNDHLVVEEDDETSLNAFRYRHATFFNRVADAIRRTWTGGEVLGRLDPGGRVFGHEDRATVVLITIDTNGAVVDLAVREPSGARPLDDEALRAIRAAQPFPNPPRALFAQADRFSFAFGFHVNFSRSTFDLNWAPY